MAQIININIEDFLKHFKTEYSFCYDNRDRVAGFAEAVAAFDEFAEKHADFVREFVRFRGDAITSDREAAAFMFALENVPRDYWDVVLSTYHAELPMRIDAELIVGGFETENAAVAYCSQLRTEEPFRAYEVEHHDPDGGLVEIVY